MMNYIIKMKNIFSTAVKSTIFVSSLLLSIYAAAIIVLTVVMDSFLTYNRFIYIIGLGVLTGLFIVYIIMKEIRIKKLNTKLMVERIKIEKMSFRSQIQLSILELLKAIVNEESIENILNIITEKACKLLSVNYSSCFIFNEKTNLFDCVATYNVSDRNILDAKILEECGIIGYVFENKQALLLNEPIDTSIFKNFIHKELPIKSAGSIPLIGRDKAIGVLNISITEGDKILDEDDINFLKVMGFFVATAYERLDNLNRLNMVMANLTVEREFIRRIISSMDEMLIAISNDGCIKFVNSAVCNLLGYEENELSQKPVGIIMGKGFDAYCDSIKIDNTDHKFDNIKMSFSSKNGQEIPVFLSFSQLKGADGLLEGILLIARDLRMIDAIKRVEVVKRESSEVSAVYDKLEAQNQELSKKSRELISLNIEFTKALKRLNEAKEKVLQNASDFSLLTTNICLEIQEPIDNIHQEISKIADGIEDNRVAIFISDVKKDIKLIESILTALATYSQCISGEYNFENIKMDAVVKESILRLRKEIDESDASIEIENDLPTVKVDREKLRLAIYSIIENAIAFRKSGFKPKIRIGSEVVDGEIRFSVQDNGIGIDEKYIDKIFEVYREFPKTVAGKGMGLAIAKKIIEEHNGRIWLESKLGFGTTCYFTLPSEKNI